MQTRKHIKALRIKEFSGYKPKPGCIKFAKKHHYFIVPNISITGDAPKDFIRYYHFGLGKKVNPNKWPLYIAKLGHKHYPMESVTEQLLTRIGEVLGFNMAKSELAWLGGQIRFLSKYFLTKPREQTLDHGADLYAGFLNDREFVENIEKEHLSATFFTVQFTRDTLQYFFPESFNDIFKEFLKLLVFDAFIGNNDRHFYNWAIIRNLLGNEKPIFSPIYDTARGLFWNEHESKLIDIYRNKQKLNSYIKKYCEASKPKIGWEGEANLNHFDLMERIKTLPETLSCDEIKKLCERESIIIINRIINKEFETLISIERRSIILLCLEYRHDRLRKILNFAP